MRTSKIANTIHSMDAAMLPLVLNEVSTTSTIVNMEGVYSEVVWYITHTAYIGKAYRKLSIEEKSAHQEKLLDILL